VWIARIRCEAARFFKRLNDPEQHPLQILEHLVIPEPDYPVVLGL
jgi:hypothetical protein